MKTVDREIRTAPSLLDGDGHPKHPTHHICEFVLNDNDR